MSILKAMRTIRILKLTRYNKDMRALILKLYQGLKDISGFAVIVFLFIFIWSLLGMELFAYLLLLDQDGNQISITESAKI